MSQESKVLKTFSSVNITSAFTPTSSITPVKSITSTSYSLTSADAGKIIVLNNTSGIALTLPVVGFSSGFSYNILVGSAHSSGSHSVSRSSSDSACLFGVGLTSLTAGSVATSSATSTFTLGTAGNVGDNVSVLSDGSKWFVKAQSKNATSAFS